ncbi:TonB-dependent receptor domain-containing protein [Salinicola peritrichatus]|uniref:TonB-dependent receptor domain-containing protein n=1 Tax=Salinicola peritrichatus TaxID=1267424 RepID=UPI000DA1B218|nr:TonB-dependent receptor [Salinicola peritrichatus]
MSLKRTHSDLTSRGGLTGHQWVLASLGLALSGTLPATVQAQSAETLAPLTVTSASASGYAVDPVHAPASISVVTREELEGKSYRDITQALQDVPGVYVDDGPTSKGGTGEISIRGFDSQYTLILVDGVPQDSSQAYYNGYGSGAEYSWLPPMAAIERIEVIRGPMSTLYGSDALGGVINIITRAVPERWTGSLTADTLVQQHSDSGNRQQGNLYLSGPLIEDTLSATFSASKLQRGEDDIEYGYPDYDRDTYSGKLSWTPNDANTLSLEAGYGDQHTRATEGRSSSSERDFETRRRHQTLTHELDWGDRLKTRSFVKHTDLDQDDGSYTSTYERTTVKSSTVIPLADHLLTVGAEYRKQEIDHPDRALGVATLERWDSALFAEDEWFLTDRFSLTTGARWVKDENYGSEFVPRLYGVFDATPTLTFKGGVSAGYRTPDLKEGDSNWLEGGGGPSCADCRDVGNSDLKPEKSLTYELAAYWQATPALLASATVFHTEFEDKIEKPVVCDTREGDASCIYLGDDYTALYQYMNVDEASVDGVELGLDWALTATLDLNASYTYTDSEQKSGENAGLPLDDQPKHRASLGLDWAANAATNIWARARFKGEAEQVAARSGLSDAYPSYTLVDAGLNYRLMSNLSLYGGVYNLFDKRVDYGSYGRVLDGRAYNAGLTLSF